jgi:hypothetical protein
MVGLVFESIFVIAGTLAGLVIGGLSVGCFCGARLDELVQEGGEPAPGDRLQFTARGLAIDGPEFMSSQMTGDLVRLAEGIRRAALVESAKETHDVQTPVH